MKLEKLIIENFLSIKEATLYLADKGLVSIEGENLDDTSANSNGSGKSSIINAILWGCYGDYGKGNGGSVADVVNKKAAKEKKLCIVTLHWSEIVGGEKVEYIITRKRGSATRNYGDLELRRKDKNGIKELTGGTTLSTQKTINTILGGDKTIFMASCFAQQESQLDIPNMTDKELKTLLEQCLSFDMINSYHALAREKKAMLSIQVDKNDNSIYHTRRIITDNNYHLGNVRKSFDDYEKTSKEKAKNLDSEIKETKAKLKAIDSKKLTMDRLKVSIDEISVKSLAIRREMQRIGEEESKGLLDKAAKDGIKISSYIYVDILNELSNFYENKKKDLTEILVLKQKCPTCHQDVLLETATEGQLKKELKEVSKNLFDVRLSLNNFLILKKEKEEKEAEGNKLSKEFHALQGEVLMEAALEKALSILEDHKKNGFKNPYEQQIKYYEENISKYVAELKEHQAKEKDINKQHDLATHVANVFGSRGIKYHLLEKITPFLNHSTNEYLDILTDGTIKVNWSTVTKNANGDYRESFSIQTIKDGFIDGFNLLSGGEKRKVRLACFFAIQDLLASRASKTIELWCGDEIDLALDTASLERLMVLLENKARQKGTILVISHNELRDWIPNYATVTKKDGFSSIKGYLNEV